MRKKHQKLWRFGVALAVSSAGWLAGCMETTTTHPGTTSPPADQGSSYQWARDIDSYSQSVEDYFFGKPAVPHNSVTP